MLLLHHGVAVVIKFHCFDALRAYARTFVCVYVSESLIYSHCFFYYYYFLFFSILVSCHLYSFYSYVSCYISLIFVFDAVVEPLSVINICRRVLPISSKAHHIRAYANLLLLAW